MISFVIPGEPTGKGRPRFTRSGRCYTPKKTQDYENQVAMAYKMVSGGLYMPISVPVLLEMDIYHALPKSTPKKRVEGMLREYPIKKGDIDNILKCVMDGISGVAYEDDRQVVAVVARKYYAAEGRVEVRISSL